MFSPLAIMMKMYEDMRAHDQMLNYRAFRNLQQPYGQGEKEFYQKLNDPKS